MMKAWLPSAFAALLLAAAPAAADILIGAAGPFSGPNAALGEQLRRGVTQAVEDINAAGGISGQPLKVSFADDGCDPRKAVEVATGFVSEGVRAVIGHYCSGASIPAARVYEKAGIAMISPASTNPRLTLDGGWNVIRLVPRDDAQGAAAATLVLEKFPGRKIAILADDSPGFAALAARFRAGLAEKGVSPSLDERFKAGAKSFSDLASKVQSAGADVVYLACSYVECGQLARALREAGSRAQIISGDALATEDYARQAEAAADGTLLTFTYDPRNFPAARSLIARMKEEDRTAEGFTLYAYAAVQALAAAADATGSSDGARLAEWLRGGTRFDTIVGPVSFDARGDLTNPAIAWLKWVDGRYVLIDPATLAPPLLDTTP
ncbi:MAG: branched-chain amino acid ABC transporter substrate-binding protein [Aestuariivirga sp.]|uniref:branched-chain amino acid ABC transporter substrate-binding protein n=1 Tax=Aestuariivirga sp. TaxID=2650926 RepID=UPI0038D1D3CE